MIKDETGRVKIIRSASTMADNSAVKTEATLGRLTPGQKVGKNTPYPTPAADLEPFV